MIKYRLFSAKVWQNLGHVSPASPLPLLLVSPQMPSHINKTQHKQSEPPGINLKHIIDQKYNAHKMVCFFQCLEIYRNGGRRGVFAHQQTVQFPTIKLHKLNPLDRQSSKFLEIYLPKYNCIIRMGALSTVERWVCIASEEIRGCGPRKGILGRLICVRDAK